MIITAAIFIWISLLILVFALFFISIVLYKLRQTKKSENRFKEVECHKFGVNAYVIKPVDFVAFMDALKGLGVFWGLINELPFEY